jgi:hypothetical protein
MDLLTHSFIHLPVVHNLEHRAPFGVTVITHTIRHTVGTPLDLTYLALNKYYLCVTSVQDEWMDIVIPLSTQLQICSQKHYFVCS